MSMSLWCRCCGSPRTSQPQVALDRALPLLSLLCGSQTHDQMLVAGLKSLTAALKPPWLHSAW